MSDNRKDRRAGQDASKPNPAIDKTTRARLERIARIIDPEYAMKCMRPDAKRNGFSG